MRAGLEVLVLAFWSDVVFIALYIEKMCVGGIIADCMLTKQIGQFSFSLEISTAHRPTHLTTFSNTHTPAYSSLSLLLSLETCQPAFADLKCFSFPSQDRVPRHIIKRRVGIKHSI